MDNIYGGISTKTFFLQELLDEMKDIDDIEEGIEYFPTINENEELPALEHTSKVKLDDIKTEIKSIVDKSYDYFDYSQKDGSNERFMEKQKNTNAFRDNIFDMIDEEEAKKKVSKFEQETLF